MHEGRECLFYIDRSARLRDLQVQIERTDHSLQLLCLRRSLDRICWVDQQSDQLGRRKEFVQQLEALWSYFFVEVGDAG